MRIWKKVLLIPAILLPVWLMLTFFVQFPRDDFVIQQCGNQTGLTAALVYNPDPFYNLDAQLAERFASTLSDTGWNTRIVSVAAAINGEFSEADLYVLIANTYNWEPDRPMQHLIQSGNFLSEKPVVALTLGSGATQRSRRIMERLIAEEGGILIASESYWLVRPNDESRLDEANLTVALDKVVHLAYSVSDNFVKSNAETIINSE